MVMLARIIAILWLASIFFCRPAFAQEIPTLYQPAIPSPVFSVGLPAAAPPKHKEPFCVRHPKIYQKWRKTRRMCQASLPVVQWVGSVAQTMMLFAPIRR